MDNRPKFENFLGIPGSNFFLLDVVHLFIFYLAFENSALTKISERIYAPPPSKHINAPASQNPMYTSQYSNFFLFFCF